MENELLAYENKKMAEFIVSLGLTDEQLSNFVINGDAKRAKRIVKNKGGVINEEFLNESLLHDVMRHHLLTVEEAEEWVDVHGEKLVDDMWMAYTNYIETEG